MHFPELFQPTQIGGLTLRNRLFQPAHSKLYSQAGRDTQRDLDYYVARAKGGVALLITGERLVHPTSPTGRPRFAYSYVDGSIDADRRITTAVHESGAAIFAQLNHVGVEGSADSVDDLRVLLGPSQLSSPLFGEVSKSMETEDIDVIVAEWARCAELSREGGFDGVELHIAHGYLLSQFLSPLYNYREDEYGGTLENRLRLTREVIAAVRARVGPDFIVGVRLGLTEFAAGGIEIDDAIEAASILRDDGLIDFINTSGGGYHSGQHRLITTSDSEGGWLIDRVKHLRSAIQTIPILAVGDLADPWVAQEVVAAGIADMVGMTRALIADPELPNKLQEGRESEINRCIRGNQGCISRVWRGLPMACTVNPAAGREGFFRAKEELPASLLERWLVIGGGPAGMKAAETAARRGHSVTLVERNDRLGGQVNLILQTPGRASFSALTEDIALKLEWLGVELRLSEEATVDILRDACWDTVVVATGAKPDRAGYSSAVPEVTHLTGAGRDCVVTGWDVLRDPSSVGQRVVILDDLGNREVAGIAEVLLDAGRTVEIVSRWGSLFPFTATTLEQPVLCRRLLEKGLSYRVSHWATAICERRVEIRNLYTDEVELLPDVDTVVLGTGRRSEDALYFAFKERGQITHRIGDCLAPRSLDHAIFEGYVTGLGLTGDEKFIAEGQLEQWDEAP